MTELESTLTQLYRDDKIKYEEKINFLKELGCHILRNSQGAHKVSYDTGTIVQKYKVSKKLNLDVFLSTLIK